MLMKTQVQFRKDKFGVFAVFPYIVETNTDVCCYSHIGQHSVCCWDINRFTKPASEQEFKDLKKELESIGYDLEVIKRRNHKEYLKAYYACTHTTTR